VRALPGRQARIRTTLPAAVSRANAHEDQRSRILRALAELVATHGYDHVTIEQIAKRAHVSYTTFYRHFSGKDEAFLAFFDTIVGFSEASIAERLERERASWDRQVISVLRALIEQVLADPILAHVVIVDAPAFGPAILDRYENALDAYVPLLRAGRELSPRGSNLPRTLEPTLAGSVLWSLYQPLLLGQPNRLPEALPQMIEVVLCPYIGQDSAGRLARAELLFGSSVP
jgi:AcrR family transcriptional regulator